MRVLVIGGGGTIGSHLVPALTERGHDVIGAGRSSGDVQVDITDTQSLTRMYETTSGLDAVVVIAASGALDRFATLTAAELLENTRGKHFGQVDVVLTGQRYLNDRGSFTLTSGIFADQAWPGVTGGAVVSGGLHSFVLSAAIELPRQLRDNVVSPTMVADSTDTFSTQFPRDATGLHGHPGPPLPGLCGGWTHRPHHPGLRVTGRRVTVLRAQERGRRR